MVPGACLALTPRVSMPQSVVPSPYHRKQASMSVSVEPTPGEMLGKHVRTAGYLILTMAALFPLIDIASGLMPPQFGNATWRFGAVGLFSNYAMGLSLELLLLAVLAALSNHRRVLLVLGVLSVLLAVTLLGSSLLFVLDALQTRARVTPAMLQRFDFATGGAIVKLVLYAVANLILARGEFLAARRLGRIIGGRTRGRVAPLVSTPAADSGRAV